MTDDDDVDQDEAGAEPAPAAAPAPGGSGIRSTDRVLVLGPTGSGKSVLANTLFSSYRCQRLLVDTKWEFRVQGVEPVESVAAIDWTAPVIHYRDHSGDLRDVDQLFRACLRRRTDQPGRYGLVVCVHELADLCGHQTGATPRWVNAYITKGRAHGLGLLGASQRPVNMPRTARSEAQHVFALARDFDPDDRPVVAKLIRRSERELDELLVQARAVGEHAFLWYDQRAGSLVIKPPLPEQLRGRSIVAALNGS